MRHQSKPICANCQHFQGNLKYPRCNAITFENLVTGAKSDADCPSALPQRTQIRKTKAPSIALGIASIYSRLTNMKPTITTQDQKFCKDCTYFTEPLKSHPRCSHPNIPKQDLVYGDDQYCEYARKDYDLTGVLCGIKAIYFTAKPDIQTNTLA